MTRASSTRTGVCVETALGRVYRPSTYDEGAYPPRGVELRWIEKELPLDGRDVLEVGCGAGRLTFQYADRARRVVAIDPNEAQIGEARAVARRAGLRRLTFLARGSQEGFRDLGRFDVALFTWSL